MYTPAAWRTVPFKLKQNKANLKFTLKKKKIKKTIEQIKLIF